MRGGPADRRQLALKYRAILTVEFEALDQLELRSRREQLESMIKDVVPAGFPSAVGLRIIESRHRRHSRREAQLRPRG